MILRMREIFSSRAWNEWSRAHFPEGILTKSGLPEGILTQILDISRASLANTDFADARNIQQYSAVERGTSGRAHIFLKEF